MADVRKYWLFKSEPASFSIDDLKARPNSTEHWDGVRNYQSRNTLRDDVSEGDGVLFHHSGGSARGVAGTCIVTRAGYPDDSQFDSESKYFDPKSKKDNPRWYMVDVKFHTKFKRFLPLSELKATPGLEKMMVTQRGARLSIQPVTEDEWKIIHELADEKPW